MPQPTTGYPVPKPGNESHSLAAGTHGRDTPLEVGRLPKQDKLTTSANIKLTSYFSDSLKEDPIQTLRLNKRHLLRIPTLLATARNSFVVYIVSTSQEPGVTIHSMSGSPIPTISQNETNPNPNANSNPNPNLTHPTQYAPY